MKKFGILSVLLCVMATYGQNVKVKKNKVLLDKKEICQFEEVKRNVYNISDLEGKQAIHIEHIVETRMTLEGEKMFRFLEFTKPGSDEIYYSDYILKGLKFSLSGRKTILRHLIKKNEFLNEKGINREKLDEFFSKSQPRSPEMEEKVAAYKKAYKAVEDYNLRIVKKRVFQKKESEDVAMGSYAIKYLKNPERIEIWIYDATGFLTATYKMGRIVLFDGESIKFRTLSRIQNDIARMVIKRMIIAGYTLGDMQAKKLDLRIKNKQNAILVDKKSSNNIYNEPATVTDEEGNTIKGEITIEFEELNASKSGMSSLKNYGGVATLKTVKENGKFKYRDYKAKNGVRICIDATNKCFLGMKANDAFSSKFNEEIQITDNLSLYKSHFFNNTYYFKKKDKKKALKIKSASLFIKNYSVKMFEKINAYLSDCSIFPESINQAEIDLEKLDDLKKIISVYNNCK